MKTILYHGSEKIIESPTYGVGKPYNDYGLAFYCTEHENLANEWSVQKNRDGYRNAYALDLSQLSILDLTDSEYCVLHWLAILLANRSFDLRTDFSKEAKQYLMDYFLLPYEKYDIIHGYRADDSYFSFAQDFLNNAISISTLSRAMKLGVLGNQYAIKSPQAFQALQFLSATQVDSLQYFNQKMARDTKARKDYTTLRGLPWSRGELYMMQILEQEVKNDDPRLR